MRVALVGLLLALGGAWADGMLASKSDVLYEVAPTQVDVAPVDEDGQRAVIHWDDGVETLLLDVTYRGAEAVAWLVPVPAPPTRDDVFLARRTVIESLFNITRPERLRQVRPVAEPENRALDWLVPWPDELYADEEALDIIGTEAESPLPPEGRVLAAAAVEQPVTVLDRFELDVYDIAVLDARSGPDLVAWLGREGFAPPVGFGPLADDYLQQGWRFVALRTTEGESAGDELRELPALGLRFASEQATFPLTISRASAPQRTVLDLMVVHDHPVHCTTLAEAPTEELAGEGVTLDQRRREVMAAHGHAALVRDGYRRLWTSDQPPGQGQPPLALDGRATSRFWSLLDHDAMVDLEFAPARNQAALRTLPHERATTAARLSLWQTLVRQPWPPVLVAWLTATLLLANGRRTDGDRTAPRESALWLTALRDAALALLTGGVLVALAYWPLRLLATAIWPGLSWLIDVHPPDRGAAALTAAALILASGVIATELRGRLRGAGQGSRRDGPQRAALATAVVALLALLGWRTENRGLALPDEAAAGAIVWATLAIVAMRTGSRRAHRRAAAAAGGIAAAAAGGIAAAFLFAACLLPTIRPPSLFAQDIYQLSAAELHDAVDRCIDDVGCLPAKLEDVARPWAPRYGVDRSGNRVDIHPARWRGPYVETMPIDPTTSRRGTWRYEPTGELIVDGGRWDELDVQVLARRFVGEPRRR